MTDFDKSTLDLADSHCAMYTFEQSPSPKYLLLVKMLTCTVSEVEGNATDMCCRYYIKPVVVFQSGFNIPTSTHAWWADHSNPADSWWCHNESNSDMPCGDGFNMNFYSHIRNVHIEVDENNPGASGLMWNVAQQTSIRNVTIDLSKSGA